MDESSSELRPFLHEGLRLALLAEQEGNLPIGAILALDGQIVGRGRNSIWKPRLALARHAEMEALGSVPDRLWARSRDMTLFTTLEPCLMCAGAVLLHNLGRVVFGALDPAGGVSSCLEALPPYFKREFGRIQWLGPAFTSECDPLYTRIVELERRRADTLGHDDPA